MQQPDDRGFERGRLARFSLPLALGLLAGISAYCVISLAQERRHSQDLAFANQQLSASLQQVRSEVRAVSDKLNTLAVQPHPLRQRRLRRLCSRPRRGWPPCARPLANHP